MLESATQGDVPQNILIAFSSWASYLYPSGIPEPVCFVSCLSSFDTRGEFGGWSIDLSLSDTSCASQAHTIIASGKNSSKVGMGK